MKFCHHCASPIVLRIPDGDDKVRHCCNHCDSVFYENPKNVVGTLPFYEDKILLCKRAIQPRLGKWTLPAGFMENGETSLEGAVRETAEEAGATVRIHDDSLYTLFNLPSINQVYLFFRAEPVLVSPTVLGESGKFPLKGKFLEMVCVRGSGGGEPLQLTP